jgi:molybdopterin/thiamine biosynthesis adenylyltransferase/rhodanese-related sulfurtransferase
MTPDLLRYSCQIVLPGFSETAQLRLQQAKVLVIGAGGLGCPSAQYLAAAGIGTLGIADFDEVSISNLHRQVLYTPKDIGLKKATVATAWLQQQNPGIKVVAHNVKINSGNIMEVIAPYDIVVDSTDNFDTRYLINDGCVLSHKPVVYGAIYQFEGQVAVWNIINPDGSYTPNYRDLFPQVDASQVPNCADGGVIPTLAGIIGCIQANEVIKYITQTGELLAARVLVFDALTLQSRVIKMGKVSKTNITRLADTVEVPVMSVADVKDGLASGTVELVDIRTDQERDAIDIGGIHFEAGELEDYLDELDGDTIKVLYCSSGKRSGEVVKKLQKLLPGRQFYSLQGGLKAWFEDIE